MPFGNVFRGYSAGRLPRVDEVQRALLGFLVKAAEVFTGMIVEPMWRQVAGGALVVVGVLILAALLRYLLRELLRAAGLGATDRFFGALFGIARGLAVAFVVVLIGGLAGVAKEPWWRDALFSAPLESAVIAAKPWLPAEVADKIRFR